MHPVLLHQMADDRIFERRRNHPHDNHSPRRTRRNNRVATRLRLGLGGLLITVGNRLVGSRAGPPGLHRQPPARA